MGLRRNTLIFSFFILVLAFPIEAQLCTCDLFTTSYDSCFNCDPVSNCGCNDAGLFVSDPSDCRNYYVCITAIDEGGDPTVMPSNSPLTCEDGYYFDPATPGCVEGETCFNECLNRDCYTECADDGSVATIAVPDDCNAYLICVRGSDPVLTSCSGDTPYYNGVNCSANSYECCNLCTPYCKTASTEVADPYDCTSYYLCLTENSEPGEEYHFECGEEQVFNPDTGFCEDGTNCESLCSSNSTKLN